MTWTWLPNALTMFRIAAAPVVGYGLWATLSDPSAHPGYQLWAMSFALFAVASLTDALDGFLARHLDATSDLGANLDLWADKILVASFFIGVWPGAAGLSLIGLLSFTVRDLFVMALRRLYPHAKLKASLIAKWKTGILFLSITLFLLAGLLALIDPDSQIREGAISGTLLFLAIVSGAIAAALSFYTGLQYARAALLKTEIATRPNP